LFHETQFVKCYQWCFLQYLPAMALLPLLLHVLGLVVHPVLGDSQGPGAVLRLVLHLRDVLGLYPLLYPCLVGCLSDGLVLSVHLLSVFSLLLNLSPRDELSLDTLLDLSPVRGFGLGDILSLDSFPDPISDLGSSNNVVDNAGLCDELGVDLCVDPLLHLGANLRPVESGGDEALLHHRLCHWNLFVLYLRPVYRPILALLLWRLVA